MHVHHHHHPQEAKDEKQAGLLSLSRRILAYTIITTLLILAIHIPATHVVPYEPVVRVQKGYPNKEMLGFACASN